MNVIIFLLITVAAMVAIYAIGMHYQRRLQREAPDRKELKPLRWFEAITASSGAILLFICIGAYELAPDSQIGAFLHEPYGIPATVIAFFLAIFIWSVLMAFIKISARDKQNGV